MLIKYTLIHSILRGQKKLYNSKYQEVIKLSNDNLHYVFIEAIIYHKT